MVVKAAVNLIAAYKATTISFRPQTASASLEVSRLWMFPASGGGVFCCVLILHGLLVFCQVALGRNSFGKGSTLVSSTTQYWTPSRKMVYVGSKLAIATWLLLQPALVHGGELQPRSTFPYRLSDQHVVQFCPSNLNLFIGFFCQQYLLWYVDHDLSYGHAFYLLYRMALAPAIFSN